MKSKLALHAIALDKNEKFEEGELIYDFKSDDDVCGYGRLIAKDVANILIDAQHDHLKKINDEKQPKSVTFGKEALLTILSQQGCEGIKFYFGKRSSTQWARECKYSKYEGLTLVAVGVDSNNKDIGTDGKNITHKGSSTLKGGDAGVIIIEVVPPDPEP
jgi:hypothetical protein